MKQLISLISISLLIFASITSTIQQQVYADKEDDDVDDKKYTKKGKYIQNWDGSKLSYDEMVERNQKCIEMERNGFLPSNVNCISFPLNQSDEKIITDYIVQMAMKGYYKPNY